MPIVMPQIDAVIPDGLTTLDAYRQWAHSEAYPEHGEFAFLDGKVWVDLSMEEAFIHNSLKTLFAAVLYPIAKSGALGRYLTDGMLVSNPKANVANEPDGMFVTFDSFSSGRVVRLPSKIGGCKEFLGSPDMTLEIVSPSSEEKDTVDLLELYFLAGVREYWLADARGDGVELIIHRRGRSGFIPVPPDANGWIASTVFSRSFRLTRTLDCVDNPDFELDVR